MLGWLRTTVSSLTRDSGEGWEEGLPQCGRGRGSVWMCLQWERAADTEQGLGQTNMNLCTLSLRLRPPQMGRGERGVL